MRVKVRTARRSVGRSAGCGGCGSDGALRGRAGPEFGRLDGAGDRGGWSGSGTRPLLMRELAERGARPETGTAEGEATGTGSGRVVALGGRVRSVVAWARFVCVSSPGGASRCEWPSGVGA